MKFDVKERWLKALRSGEYDQGTTYLHNAKENKYCCLGVLADIEDAFDFRGDPNSYRNEFSGFNDEDSSGYSYTLTSVLPANFTDSINLERDNARKLVNMNDNGFPFTYIADWIEENL